jgi:hypothetical protein
MGLRIVGPFRIVGADEWLCAFTHEATMIPSAPMNMKGILAVGLLFAPYQFYGATSP